jgi:hypothetical protein
VWEATFPAGRIVLGGLGGNPAYNNYFVVVKPLDSSWVVPYVSKEQELPSEYAEGMAAYPNPFNPQVLIAVQCRFSTGKKNYDHTAAIYDLQGKRIAVLEPNRIELSGKTGRFEYVWNAVHQASGVYLISVSAGSRVWQKKVTLVR